MTGGSVVETADPSDPTQVAYWRALSERGEPAEWSVATAQLPLANESAIDQAERFPATALPIAVAALRRSRALAQAISDEVAR